jgi:hypothetical protein
VSPAVRVAVNAVSSSVPFVVSLPADAPFTVLCVLPVARPVTVKSLELLTVLVSLL